MARGLGLVSSVFVLYWLELAGLELDESRPVFPVPSAVCPGSSSVWQSRQSTPSPPLQHVLQTHTATVMVAHEKLVPGEQLGDYRVTSRLQ